MRKRRSGVAGFLLGAASSLLIINIYPAMCCGGFRVGSRSKPKGENRTSQRNL